MEALFHYAVITQPESELRQSQSDGIDMENVDYKRQPDVQRIRESVMSGNGFNCGLFRGGMFGLKTNQLAALTSWPSRESCHQVFDPLCTAANWSISDACWLTPTVRPKKVEAIERQGIYVIRWIRMAQADVDEYIRLCLETWPAFESMAKARCYGVFKPADSGSSITTLLMLTWYATLTDWEQSRRLHIPDANRWARRSEMELSHWAEAGRLA